MSVVYLYVDNNMLSGSREYIKPVLEPLSIQHIPHILGRWPDCTGTERSNWMLVPSVPEISNGHIKQIIAFHTNFLSPDWLRAYQKLPNKYWYWTVVMPVLLILVPYIRNVMYSQGDCNIPDLDLVNTCINSHAKFGQIPSILSQDIEQKKNSVINQGS